MKEDLYLQCAWFASTVMDGYYGWREGRTLVVDYLDGQVVRLAPQLNAGTIGLMHAFAKLYDFDEWAVRLYGEESFFTLFETMFDSPVDTRPGSRTTDPGGYGPTGDDPAI